MNPFGGSLKIIEDASELFGRERDISKVQQCVSSQRDLLIQGIEGSGKTSLLNTALCSAFRQEVAEKNSILVTRPFTYPVRLNEEHVFPFLMDKITETLRLIPDRDLQAEIRKTVEEQKSEYRNASEQFKNAIITLHDLYGFRVVLVMDNFERFTTSTSVTVAQHEVLRDLMESANMTFIAATDYDISKDAVPPGIRGSYLLQKFGGREYSLAGLKKEQIVMILSPEMKKLELSDDQINEMAARLRVLTGGNPAAVQIAAARVYDALLEQPYDVWQEKNWESVAYGTYADAQILLEHWCGLLSEPKVSLLKHLGPDNGVVNDLGEATILASRGMLIKDPAGGGRYAFASELLRRYVEENELEVAYQQELKQTGIPVTFNIDQMRALASPLAQQIMESIREQSGASLSISKEGMESIESIYEQYRRDYPNELTDSLVNSLGEFCINEIKQGLLFKALSGDAKFGDLSRAGVISYGVAMEIRLKDCFVELFKQCGDFSVTDRKNLWNKEIGPLLHIIEDNEAVLTKHCSALGLATNNLDWWKKLVNQSFIANNLRIKGAHAKKPTAENVQKLHDILLAPETGLLNRLGIGTVLFSRLCGKTSEKT